MSRRHLAIAAGAVAAGGTAWALWQGYAGQQAAPQVTYTLLDGQKTSTQLLKGQVVLVNFWATSCASCVAKMPDLAALHEKYSAKGYTTVAVAMRHDPPAHVADFAAHRKLPFGVAIDNTGEIARSFGNVRVTPTSMLINKQGQIVKRYEGTPDFSALQRLVEQLLAEA